MQIEIIFPPAVSEETTMRKIFLLILFLITLSPFSATANECPHVVPDVAQRYVVVISDLHFGMGRAGKTWSHKEDFRWSKALAGFLERISTCGRNSVDLVIAGDSMELWQPPNEDLCLGVNPNTGCTRSEVFSLTKMITAAHSKDFLELGRFSNRGTNRVFFIPGNHDAAILFDEVWGEVRRSMNSASGRVFRCGKIGVKPCTTGALWVSEDGQVVIEHGHQIGNDVNNFPNWPDISTNVNNVEYMHRSWGEWFVQSLFNAEEDNYPIIDNLIPEAAGARYRMADRGLWKSVQDVSRFMRFNLFETSFAQKMDSVGRSGSSSSIHWDVDAARDRGYRLFAEALPKEDPFRIKLESNSSDFINLRNDLTSLVADKSKMTDAEIKQLCNQIIIQSEGKANCDGSAGAVIQRLTRSKDDVMASHLRIRIAKDGLTQMRVFIYAHTHQLEVGHIVNAGNLNDVDVFNTGAFQRLVDEPGFVARAKAEKISPGAALKNLKIEKLPPCYTAVVVALEKNPIEAATIRWKMEENEKGLFVQPGNSICN